MTEFLGLQVNPDPERLLNLVGRLGLNLVFASLVIRGVYYRLYKNAEYVFTYYAFNVITFCLSVLLMKVPVQLGFALGLFAVFGILRYRTEAVQIRDQTYLFIVIGLGIVNAVANESVGLMELVTVNSVVVALIAVLEFSPRSRDIKSTVVLYDNMELIKPGCESELFCDLVTRTGLRVVRIRVRRVDMLRDAAEIEVFYRVESVLE